MTWWNVGAVAVGTVGTVVAGNKAAKGQQAAIDAQSQAAARGDALSQQRFDWNRWVYENDIAPANKANQELQFLLAEDYLDTSRQQKDFAQEQRDEYVNTALPNERRVFADAANYDSDANVKRRSGQAIANVNQQFSNAGAQLARTAGRYGLNSSMFADRANKTAIAQAATASGAGTGAAFETMDRAIGLRAAAANLGRNMPNTAGNFFSGSNNSNAGASGASSASAGAAGAGAPFMNQAYNQRVGGIYQAGNAMAGANLGAASMWGGVAQGLGNLTGAGLQGLGGLTGLGTRVNSLFSGGLGTSRQMDTTPLNIGADGAPIEGWYGGGA